MPLPLAAVVCGDYTRTYVLSQLIDTRRVELVTANSTCALAAVQRPYLRFGVVVNSLKAPMSEGDFW